MSEDRAILALADGTIFEGISIGASGMVNGEIVFNTSMTGYQEILTDPSYAKQIVTLTYPHIGNTGTNQEDKESNNIWSSGLVVRSVSQIESNWRTEETLSEYLIKNQILGVSNIDTRKLTRIIRNKGAQSAAIVAGESANSETAIELANEFKGLAGMDLAKEVTTSASYDWNEGTWRGKKDKSNFKIKYRVSGEAFLTKPNKTTYMIQDIIKKVTKIKPKLSTTGGTSDARFIRKISPCLEFGLVNKTMHKVDECVPIKDLKNLTRIYKNILEDYFR